MHVLAVCQPAVPLIAAVALMEAAASDATMPDSMILMGGPIDTRRSPTAVNKLAERRTWNATGSSDNCISRVPLPYPGVGREVYPVFLGNCRASCGDESSTGMWMHISACLITLSKATAISGCREATRLL